MVAATRPLAMRKWTVIRCTTSNAMQGEYSSINDGLVLLSTLIGWNYAIDRLSHRFPIVARFLEAQPEVLIRHGRINRKAMKREMITQEELDGKLREAGVEDLSQVRIARLESDGKLSVFKARDANLLKSMGGHLRLLHAVRKSRIHADQARRMAP